MEANSEVLPIAGELKNEAVRGLRQILLMNGS